MSPARAKLIERRVCHTWRDIKVREQEVSQSVLAHDEAAIGTAGNEHRAIAF